MAKPINWKLNLAFIWLVEICARAGFSVAVPFVPFYMRDRYLLGEADVKTNVMLFGIAGSLALFFSFPLWGMLGDRKGRRLMLLRATFCSGILYAAYMFAPVVGVLVLMRFIAGFFSGTVSPAQALVVSTTPEKHHGFALGMLSSSVWVGNAIGFAIGGFVVKYCQYNEFWDRLFHLDRDSLFVKCWSYNVAFSLTMTLFLIAGFITLFLVRENFVPPPPKPKTAAAGVRSGWVFGGFGCAVYAILGMFLWMSFARRCDESYISLLVEVVSGLKGQKAADIAGYISGIGAIGCFIAAISVGFISDRLSPRKIIIPIAVVGTAAMLVQALAPNPWVLGAARFMTFAVAGGLEPTVLALLSRESPPERRGTIFGLVASLRIFGLLLGTVFGWAVMRLCDKFLTPGQVICGVTVDPHGFGIRGVVLVGALAMLALIPWIFFVERMVERRHRLVAEQK
ncbi:MAG: MFS transporter [Lentisphaeria bacterium]|nr:MFS transporter [Lentisphaeria bacterium]